MKTRVIIQSRMGSSRLRGKSLMPVAGISLLERVINAAKKMPFVDEIMVATTDLPEDAPIVAVSIVNGVLSFKGSASNVLERYYGASADMDENDLVVRITADNPLNFLDISKQAFDEYVKNGCDYLCLDGLSHVVPEFIKVRALRDIYGSKQTTLFDQEHVTPYLRKNQDIFNVKTLPAGYMGLRSDLDKFLTIDNSEDLYRMESLFRDLEQKSGDISAIDFVYNWIERNVLKIVKERKEEEIVIDFHGTRVGTGYPTFIIAEIGQNHNGDVNIAKRLIDMAVRCGANAVKFQKRDIDSELTKEAFDKIYDNPNSFGRTYGEHRIFLELDEQQHGELKEYALASGITYFCTPCDTPSVELLERINCPFYKVASRDLTNIPLLERIGKTGKPVIISTGMADFNDIDNALKALDRGPESVVIMQCTSEYPCKLENVNLRAMDTLRKKYGHLIGLSDHSSGVIVSAAAAVMGAVMIEKHITLDRSMKGTDQPGSLEEAGLKKLVEYIRAIEIANGDGVKDVNPATQAAKLKLARSLTSKVFIAKGTVLTEEMLILKSPGNGLKWIEREQVIGKQALQDIEPDVTIEPNSFR
jgi:sialic acid synthase SpsE/spore coat polysaccharide biosynthesis protein SpsF (cytidylyltransferase family)